MLLEMIDLDSAKAKFQELRTKYPFIKEKVEPTVKKVGEKLTPVHGWQSVLLACIITFAFLATVNTVMTRFPGAVASSSEAQPKVAQKSDEGAEFKFTKEAKVLSSSLSEAVPPAPEQPVESAPEPPTEVAYEAPQPETNHAYSAPVYGPVAEPAEEKGEVELARAVVENFYSDLGDGNTGAAYDKLSPAFRYHLSYERFRLGYENTCSMHCEVKHSELLADDKVRLDVQLEIIEDGIPVAYLATCVVTKSEDQWLLDGVAQLKS